jgi:aminocarboxymuconate-semialdehyde decarboxylase
MTHHGAAGRRPLAQGTAPMATVDLHSHVFPQALAERIAAEPERMMARRFARDGGEWIHHDQGFLYPLVPEFLEPAEKLAAMDRLGLDYAVISPSPTLFYHWAEPALEQEIARVVNDGVAELAAASDRLRPMGQLPLGEPHAAVAELERIHREHGMRCVILGTAIEGTVLADERFFPVLKRCAELGVWILAHPYYLGGKSGLEPYYLTNLIGNPLETAVLGAHLMFSGTLERLPDLNVLLAHAGGFLPYQLGRLIHGQEVRVEARMRTTTSPDVLVRRLFFDTITFDSRALRFLIDRVGVERIGLGTDSPFDMADPIILERIAAVPGLTDKEKATILSEGAAATLMGERFA